MLDVPDVIYKRLFLSRICLQVLFSPPSEGHTLYLISIEVFLQCVAMFILRPFCSGRLKIIASWPDTPYPFPVFQSHIVSTRPFACSRLITSLVEMFFNALFLHSYFSFPGVADYH